MSGVTRPTAVLLAAMVLGVAGAIPPPSEDEGKKQKDQDTGPPIERIVIHEETFELELAADPKSREKGLMGRKSIAEHGGMLFVFADRRRCNFWMKNCLVNMDIMYLDRDGRIVAMYTMKVERPKRSHENEMAYERRLRTYPSRRPAQFAIELKAGSNKRLKLKVGETITLDRARLTELAKKNEPPKD